MFLFLSNEWVVKKKINLIVVLGWIDDLIGHFYFYCLYFDYGSGDKGNYFNFLVSLLELFLVENVFIRFKIIY